MRKLIREFLSFTRTELKIIAILTGLITISLFVRLFFPLPDFQPFRLSSEDSSEVDSFIRSLEKIRYEKPEKVQPDEDQEHPVVYSRFDPNVVNIDELTEKGFPEAIAKRMLHYRQAGGKFREKSDLKRLYGFSDSLFDKWKEYIAISEPFIQDSFSSVSFNNSKRSIDLNKTDSSGLVEINGVGPFFAGQILKYRGKLGGFVSIWQLLEVKGMDSVKIENIITQVFIDSLSVKKINLNAATINELKRHPYITPRIAESILKFRQFSGQIKNCNELLENRLISEKDYQRLLPYLKVE